MTSVLITGQEKRSQCEWRYRGRKGITHTGLAFLASAAAALCLTGLTGAAAAQAAPPPAGLAFAWGENFIGQLGDGTAINRSVPVQAQLPAGTSVTAVAAGNYHSLALTSDGRVLAWGDNVAGQLGIGSTVHSTTPVPVHLPAGTDVTAVAAGALHSLALTSGGGVLAWGQNFAGQLGNGTTTGSTLPVPVDLPAGTQITAIAAGGAHSLALTSDGRVLAWGYNPDGELGNGTTTSSAVPVPVDLPAGVQVTAIAASTADNLALTSDGRVLAWGDNRFGELGDGSSVTFSATPVVVNLPAGTCVSAVAGGAVGYSLIVTCDGRVLAWGENTYGQLGDGTTANSAVPVPVDLPAGTSVTAVAAADRHVLALTSSGRVLAWGFNGAGQLGNHSLTSSSVPVPALVPCRDRVTAIAAGTDDFSLVVAVPSA